MLEKMPMIETFNTSSIDYSTFVTIFYNLAEVDEFVKSVKAHDGVKIGIMNELLAIQSRLKEQIIRWVSLHYTRN